MKKRLKDIAFIIFLIAFAVFMISPTYVKPSAMAAEEVAKSYMRKQSSIEEFEIVAATFWTDDEHIQFIYNVKPTEGGKEKWTADGGEVGDDGWVTGKTAFIRYFKIGNIYITGLKLRLKLPNSD